MLEQTYTKKLYKPPQTDALKIPPHSTEAEQSVLGGLMLSNDAWDQISEIVHEQDFYLAAHRLIFRAMTHLFKQNQPLDVLTVMEALKETKELNGVGGEVYLFELAKNTPSIANIQAYANIVHKHSVLRQLITVSNEIASSAFNPSGREVTELLDEAELKVFAIAEQGVQRSTSVPIQQLLTQAVKKVDAFQHSKKSITGLTTSFCDLDKMTSGLQNDELIIVAGRPSMGKTILGINIAQAVAIKEEKSVLAFSMEMSGDAIAMRMLSSLGRIEQNRIRTGDLREEDWSNITSATNMLAKTKMFIDDTPALSPGEVRSRARRLARDQGDLGLIVIDYLQLMRVPGRGENRVAEISEISRSLKALARELHVPVIALSQLNRSLEQRSDRRPMMSDLRDSGALEQDADLIIFIYRDEVYNENSPDKGVAEIIIGKQRNGPTGKIRLKFFGQFMRFESCASERPTYGN